MHIMTEKFTRIIHEEFEAMSDRLGKLLDVFISEHSRYDECIFVSNEVSYCEVKQRLAQKGHESLINRFNIVTCCDGEHIQELFDNVYKTGYESHKRTLVLLHTTKPVKIPDYEFEYLTVFNYTQKQRCQARGWLHPYMFVANEGNENNE